MSVDFDKPNSCIEVRLECIQVAPAGLRTPKRQTCGINGGDTTQRHKKHDRTSRPVELFSGNPAKFSALLRSRTHQGYVRVVNVKAPPPPVLFRNRIERTKVDHVDRARTYDLRNPFLCGGFQPMGSSAHYTAQQLIREFGRSDV